jgi:hypothetical protein
MYQIKKFPDPFLMKDGRRVATKEDWQARRKEILEQMLDLQYGTQAPAPEQMNCVLLSEEPRKDGETWQKFRMVMVPSNRYPDIEFSMAFTLIIPPLDAIAEKRDAVPGFAKNGRLPVHLFVGGDVHYDVVYRGYMHVMYEKSGREGIQDDYGKGNPVLPPGSCKDAYRTLNELEPGAWDFTWGNISAWAWGASRLLDYLLTRDDVDRDHVIISGHSVNGKTALLAAALDERFTMVNPSCSGCGGAASYLHLDGLMPDGAFEQQTEPPEDLKALTSKFRWFHWMASKLHEFSGREHDLPFDQHFLMATIAPRLLFRTEGDADWWANPMGTCAAYLATEVVWKWLGCKDRQGMVWHKGGHTHGFEDRAALLDFAEMHWFGMKCDRNFHVPCTRTDAVSMMPRLFDWDAPR